MPLLLNTGQPYFPDPNSPANADCGERFCYLVSQGDVIRNQFYQTPCNSNLIEDNMFSDVTLGSDLLGGAGSFTGGTTGWTLGAGWAYGTNNVVKTAGNDNGIAYGSVGMVLNTFYRITFTIVRTAGSISVQLGDGAGSNQSAYVDQSDTYVVDLRWGDALDDTLAFVPSDDFAGTLDSVTIQPITYNAWDPDLVWDLSDGRACKTNTANAATLTETVADYIVADGYYTLTLEVTNYLSGSLTVQVGNVTDDESTVITADGIYTLYFSPTATGVVSFVADTTFSGCIEGGVTLQALRRDFEIEIVDSEGNVTVITDAFSYWRDKVTMAINLDAEGFEYGCYTMQVFDSCLTTSNNLVADPEFTNGDFTNWQRNNAGNQYAMTGGELEFIFEPLEGANLISNGDFATGDFTDWSAGAGWSVVGNAAVHTPGSTATLEQTVTISPPVLPPLGLYHWVQFTIAGRTAGSVRIGLADQVSAVFNTNDVITFPIIPTVAGTPTVQFTITPTSDFDGSVDAFALHETTNIWVGQPSIANTANPSIVAGNYDLEVDIVSLSGGSPGNLGVMVDIQSSTGLKTFGTVTGVHTQSITDYEPGNQRVQLTARFRVGNIYYPGRIRVDDVSAVRVEPFDAAYLSQCINFQERHEGSRLLTGYCDQTALGFEFTETEFKIQYRTHVRSLNPFFAKTKIIGEYGSGDARVVYAESTKMWQFTTDLMDESAHDALSTMLDCDHFLVGNSEANSKEYIAEAGDYTPSHRAEGDYVLSPVTLNLRLKTGGQKYNRHTIPATEQ